jgi:TrmH family RNA methyltransferase
VRDGSLIPRFGRARRDPGLAVLEGFHPVKHALRFGAAIEVLATPDATALSGLVARLAPDLAERIAGLAQEVEPAVFDQLAPMTPATGAIAIAERPAVDAAALLTRVQPAPVILLEDPRDLGNIGACIRVAAGAEAAGLISTGSHDPWHPDVLRGAAGLHYAIPVAHLADLTALDGLRRPLLALDPDGDPFDPGALDPSCVLAFGTERHGLSEALSARAQARVSIPMRPGVSSLNLATSVAAVLFAWRLAGARPASGA